MIELDITSDIRAALVGAERFEREVPFAMSQALVDTAFEAQSHIVNTTWNEAFEVRNKRAPGVFFKVTDLIGQPLRRGSIGGLTRNLRYTGQVDVLLADVKHYDWIKRQATGGVKTGRSGGSVGVPKRPGEVRSPTGRVRKPLKPRNITNKKKYYLYQKGGRKVAIMERVRGGKDKAKYLILDQPVPIKKTFRFYEDSEEQALRFFPGALDRRLGAVIDRFVRRKR